MSPGLNNDNSFAAIPAEIRLLIINELLPAGPIGHSWLAEKQLTVPVDETYQQQQEPQKHGLLYVNRQINQEYTEELYKRTKFFLYVDHNNLEHKYFWRLFHPALSHGVRHMRQCTVYFDIPNTYRERTPEFCCSRLHDLKALLLTRGFDKLVELRLIVKLPPRQHLFSHGRVEMTDSAIKNAWMEDLMQLPRLDAFWLAIGDDIDERVRRVAGRWESEPRVLSKAVLSIMANKSWSDWMYGD